MWSESDTLTYEELERKASSLAGQFRVNGYNCGDRIIMQIPNSPEFLIVFYALLKAQLVPVLALPGHRKRELDVLIRYSGAAGYIGVKILMM